MKVLELCKVNNLRIEVEFKEHEGLFTIKPFGDYMSFEKMAKFAVTEDDLKKVAALKLDRIMAHFEIRIPNPMIVPEAQTPLDEHVAKFSFKIACPHFVLS